MWRLWPPWTPRVGDRSLPYSVWPSGCTDDDGGLSAVEPFFATMEKSSDCIVVSWYHSVCLGGTTQVRTREVNVCCTDLIIR